MYTLLNYNSLKTVERANHLVALKNCKIHVLSQFPLLTATKQKNKLKRKFDFCFSSRNSVFLRGTLNETFSGLEYWRFARNTLSETKIQNLHP